MKRIRIIVAGILALGILLGGIFIYEFFHTEIEPPKTVDKIKEFTGEEQDAFFGGKKLPKDYWSLIDGRLAIYSDTQLQMAESLKIPATYEGEKVHSIDIRSNRESFSTVLKHVEIEDGVEEIDCCFVSCPNLEAVVIPKSIKKMDEVEFRDCKAKVTLYVEKGSYAEKWAKKNDVRYEYGKPKGES